MKEGIMFNIRNLRRHIVLVAVAIALCLSAVVNVRPASAGGMGGINVRPARVCLDGVRFTGTVVNINALNRIIDAKIFAGWVGTPSPLIATGNSQIFTVLNSTKVFTVSYPVGTFAVGDKVTYSALANDLSGYGGGQFAVVQNCYLFRKLSH
jgi:hypothetical protein